MGSDGSCGANYHGHRRLWLLCVHETQSQAWMTREINKLTVSFPALASASPSSMQYQLPRSIFHRMPRRGRVRHAVLLLFRGNFLSLESRLHCDDLCRSLGGGKPARSLRVSDRCKVMITGHALCHSMRQQHLMGPLAFDRPQSATFRPSTAIGQDWP